MTREKGLKQALGFVPQAVRLFLLQWSSMTSSLCLLQVPAECQCQLTGTQPTPSDMGGASPCASSAPGDLAPAARAMWLCSALSLMPRGTRICLSLRLPALTAVAEILM